MKSIKNILLLSALLLVSVAGYTQNKDELRDRIEKMNSKMAEQMIAGNYNASLEFYSDDVISLPNWDEMIKGKDAIRQSNEEMNDRDMKINDFKFETVDLMECGDMVIEIGKYKMSMKSPQMQDNINDHGKYMTVWEKQDDGSLKIKADIWNTSQSPMALMEYMPRKEEMKEGMHEGMHEQGEMHEKKWDDKEKWDDKKKWEEKEGKKK